MSNATIYTRADGTPFERPDPADFATAVEFIRAFHAYRDAIADESNRAFDDQFRRSMRRGRETAR